MLVKLKGKAPVRLAVAQAEDREVLEALKEAEKMGIIVPCLFGNKVSIDYIATQVGLVNYEVTNCQDEDASIMESVMSVRQGVNHGLMKGLVNTSDFMRGVLNKEWGLRSGQLISHMAVYEIPTYNKLLFCTDSGVNVSPDLNQKQDILENALAALSSLDIREPKVCILSSNEQVSPKIPSTMDADALVKLSRQGAFLGAVLEGPMALDVAFSKAAAEHKGIISEISGEVDLLLFPNIEAGNALGKSWLHFNQAKWAGILLGAKSPIILGSRSDTAEVKINSILLGCLICNQVGNIEL